MAITISASNEMKIQGITGNGATMGEAGEISAAIAMALFELRGNVHDVENTVITINRVKRRYSPWSSKIYALREAARRK